MADNTNITPGAGEIISTDDLGGGVKVQRTKVQFGADGSATDVAAGAPLPVDIVKIPTAAALSDTLANPTTFMVGAGNLLWNTGSSQWQRVTALTGDAQAGAGIAPAGIVGYNGATFDRVRTAQGATDASTGIGELVAVSKLYNGATYDRYRTAKSDGSAVGTAGAAASVPHRWNGTTYFPDTTAGQIADADAGNGIGMSSPRDYNGATYDRHRNNVNLTLLSSAARTSSPSIAQQTNFNASGVIVVLNVTSASGTGGLTLTIQGVDPVGGVAAFNLNVAPAAVITTGVFTYAVYPGISAGYTQAVSAILPRLWAVQVVHGDGSSYTYTLGASYVI